jgi:hypothetical protein
MEIPELKKQFALTLYESEILITTEKTRLQAYQENISIKHRLMIGWHDWIETNQNALNYYECCGILILFGIEPPSFQELCGLLSIKLTEEINVCQDCREKDVLITHLNQCIEQQKGSIKMLHEELGKN